jgi:hypothetical protein
LLGFLGGITLFSLILGQQLLRFNSQRFSCFDFFFDFFNACIEQGYKFILAEFPDNKAKDYK